jgi:hypothetical protein
VIIDVPEDLDEPLNRDQLVAKAKFICGKIIDGEMTPYDGAKMIWNECHYRNMPADHTFDPFVYWADEYESADDDDRRLFCEQALTSTVREFLGGPGAVLDPSRDHEPLA